MARTVVDAGFLEIANGSGLDDVANEKTLHSLVLGHHGAGRLAEHALDLSDEKGREWIKSNRQHRHTCEHPPLFWFVLRYFSFVARKSPKPHTHTTPDGGESQR